ncbi:MAG: DMT family transporter [Planctomycetota bacterium]
MLPPSAPLVGEAAGLGTACLWVVTSLCFAAAGKRLGVSTLNLLRLLIAIVLLATTLRLTSGSWWPSPLTDQQLVLLAISGVVGLAIGDQALFTAFVDIGPRLSLLLMTTAPIIAALLGWGFLGEQLTPLTLVGIAVTVSGVAWVIAERPATGADVVRHPHHTRGVILALIGAACQAAGLMLSKAGMGHLDPSVPRVDPLAGTLVRAVFGVAALALVILALGKRMPRERNERIKDQRTKGLTFAFMGAVFGPYLGVWLSLVAADNLPVGVAQTLMSLTPVLILPVAAFALKERISVRAVIGAVVAVAGVALLFLEPSA